MDFPQTAGDPLLEDPAPAAPMEVTQPGPPAPPPAAEPMQPPAPSVEAATAAPVVPDEAAVAAVAAPSAAPVPAPAAPVDVAPAPEPAAEPMQPPALSVEAATAAPVVPDEAAVAAVAAPSVTPVPAAAAPVDMAPAPEPPAAEPVASQPGDSGQVRRLPPHSRGDGGWLSGAQAQPRERVAKAAPPSAGPEFEALTDHQRSIIWASAAAVPPPRAPADRRAAGQSGGLSDVVRFRATAWECPAVPLTAAPGPAGSSRRITHSGTMTVCAHGRRGGGGAVTPGGGRRPRSCGTRSDRGADAILRHVSGGVG